jgi:hypothetical protein
MEIAASTKGVSKEYKTGDIVITALQPTTFDFIKREKIYLIFLTGILLETLLDGKYDFSPFSDDFLKISNTGLLLSEEIRQIEYQTGLSKQNIVLYEENLSLNQDRFDKGQINACDLLTDEIDFQIEQSTFNEKRAELVSKNIELINNSGALSLFIENL